MIIDGIDLPDDATPQEIAQVLAAEGKAGVSLGRGSAPITEFLGEDQPIEANPLGPGDVLAGARLAQLGVLGFRGITLPALRMAGRRLFGKTNFDEGLREAQRVLMRPSAVRSANLPKVAYDEAGRVIPLRRSDLYPKRPSAPPELIPEAVAAPPPAAAAEPEGVAVRAYTRRRPYRPAKRAAKARGRPSAASESKTASRSSRPSQAMRGASGPKLERRQAQLERVRAGFRAGTGTAPPELTPDFTDVLGQSAEIAGAARQVGLSPREYLFLLSQLRQP